MAALRVKSKPQQKPLRSSGHVYEKLAWYQKDGVEFAVEQKTTALFFEQGVGKTWIAGGVIERLLSPQFEGLLIGLLSNLESTWLKFLAAELPQVTVCRTIDAFKVAPSPKLLVLNYEALPGQKNKHIAKLRRRHWTIIICDEAQRAKNRTSLTSRTLHKLRDRAEYKLLLTGTPMDASPGDLWSQFKFINEDVFTFDGENSWKAFQDHFFEPIAGDLEERFGAAKPGSFRWKMLIRQLGIANGKREFDFSKMDEFNALIRPYVMRVTKDVLNLKKMHSHVVPVRLRGEQRRIYDTLARDMVAKLSHRRVVTTPLKVTQLGRLHQICGGYLPDDDGDVHEVGRAKLRVTKRLVARMKKPIVIFCRYLEEVWSLEEELAGGVLRIRTLTGQTKKKERGPLIDEFQRGDIDVLICQIKTGGVGIDLFRSTVAIFYSSTYSYIDTEQALSRLHRRGQEYEVHLFFLYAIDTVDEAIASAILEKRRITRLVLTQLEQRRYQNGKGSRDFVQVRRARTGRQAGRQRNHHSRQAA